MALGHRPRRRDILPGFGLTCGCATLLLSMPLLGGAPLESVGIQTALIPLGVTIAFTFVGVPFVVGTQRPTLEVLERKIEGAAASLGANRLSAGGRVVVPMLLPSSLAGFALALARALGEFGSVVFTERFT